MDHRHLHPRTSWRGCTERPSHASGARSHPALIDAYRRPRVSGNRVGILGVGFDRVDLERAVGVVLERLRRGERTTVITANPEFVMLARREADLRAIAARADLVIPDGTGVLLASRVLGDPLPGRAPGRFLVDALAAHASSLGVSFFLLGAAPGV